MLAPPEFRGHARGAAAAQAAAEIEGKYTASGMYRNDGSSEPLWTVDWYAYHVELAPDGIHLVRPGGLTTGPEDTAVAFYANGKLLRSYRVRELVSSLGCADVIGGAYYVWQESSWLDTRRMTYVTDTKEYRRYAFGLTTGRKEYRRYTFDLTTGRIVSVEDFRGPPWRRVVLLWLPACVPCLIAVLCLVGGRPRRARPVKSGA